MAFVSQADRQIEKFPFKTVPGPGTYNQQKIIKQNLSYAPFLSTSLRQNIFTNNKANPPGPGLYECKIQNKNILKVYQNQSSIVVKINSLGSTPFQSQIKRFSESGSPHPGPGYYFEDNQNININKKKKKRKYYSFIKKSHNQPSINSKTIYLTRNPLLQQFKQELRTINKNNNKKGCIVGNWSKNTQQRFKTQPKTHIGPGMYHTDVKHKKIQLKSQTSNFTSKTVRTFFDTLIYQTQNQMTLQLRKNTQFKKNGPAPGSYQTTIKQVSQYNEKYKNDSFGSNQQRFSQNKQYSQTTDVPFYDINSSKLNKTNKIPFSSQKSRQVFINQQQTPGPGYYQFQKQEIFKKIKKLNVQNFGSLVSRFNNSQSNDQLGPGYYKIQNKRSKTQQSKPTHYFRESTSKTKPQKIDYNFGKYDNNALDISRKVQSQKQYINNLKKISFQKPGFDIKQARFKHYENLQQKQKGLTAQQKQFIYSIQHEQKRQFLIQQAKKQKNKSGTITKSPRFKQPKNSPGVGDYLIRNNWTKKSFNLKYKIQN